MSAATQGKELVCQDFVELVTEYLEGSLPADALAECEKHLEECPYCKFYLEQMRKTIGLLGNAVQESLPEDMRVHLLEAFRSQVAANGGGPTSQPSQSWLTRLQVWRRRR
ncbi:MAG TPA: zf-HC2 domain-containing protein [Dehalococcoidia bacterium]|nr:zf-HC2 domain-containing protein [Dehalococcoidia bacterium]